MPVVIACPSCGGKLRVADELRGQRIRCPGCNRTFDSTNPAPQDLPFKLALDEAEPPPAPAANGTPGLLGAVELKSALDEQSTDPAPPPQPPPPIRSRRPPRIPDEDEDIADLVHRGPRRDAEPDRGAVVLTLGILSLASLMIWCTPVGSILGLIAWIMGQTDLRKMKRGQMDTYGRGMTQAGWICGILGTSINTLATLACLSFFGFGFFSAMNQPPLTAPMRRPPPQMKPQRPTIPAPAN